MGSNTSSTHQSFILFLVTSFESNRTLGIRTLDSILNHSLSTFGARNKWFAQLPSLARSNNCLHLHSAASTDFLASNTAHEQSRTLVFGRTIPARAAAVVIIRLTSTSRTQRRNPNVCKRKQILKWR